MLVWAYFSHRVAAGYEASQCTRVDLMYRPPRSTCMAWHGAVWPRCGMLIVRPGLGCREGRSEEGRPRYPPQGTLYVRRCTFM